jgi:hypothetical protein
VAHGESRWDTAYCLVDYLIGLSIGNRNRNKRIKVGEDAMTALAELFVIYQELPEFVECNLSDVNQIGNFGNRPLHVAASRRKCWVL